MAARLLLSLSLMMWFLSASAQKGDSTLAEYDEIMGIVSLYKYMLNTVGNENTPVREKETIINTSYLKIFRDQEVQIEDDLMEGRSVILNKSVSAYLRDIDFFFQSVNFSFSDVSIDSAQTENGDHFYQVKMTVQLDAIDLEEQEINRTYDRYLEINSLKEEGLKIVSVYTTKRDISQQLMDWWEQMDTVWHEIFSEQIGTDSIGISELKEIVSMDSLDLSRKFQISDLSPLSQLRQLVYLNVSQTQVTDLLPIRYASNLKHLDISYASISELEVLSYFKSLSHLDVKGCHLLDHQFLEYVPQLISLNVSETALIDFSGLSQLRQIQFLDLSNTSFQDTKLLDPLDSLKKLDMSRTNIQSIAFEKGLPHLKALDVSSTYISKVDFIKYLPRLEKLSIEYTEVSDLTAVIQHPSLKRILADFSKVKATQVNKIMSQRKDLIILTETDLLISWWNELPSAWVNVLTEKQSWRKMPTIENLILYLQADSLDLSGSQVKSVEPLKRFKQLTYLNLARTEISDLSFLSAVENLRYLDVSGTSIASLDGIADTRQLQTVRFSNTRVSSLALLQPLADLKLVYADSTDIPDSIMDEWVASHNGQTIIYRSEELTAWWDNLAPAIKKQLKPQMAGYSVEELHRLVAQKSLSVEKFEIRNFDDLEVFRLLNRLEISGVQETFLPDLTAFDQLDTLIWKKSPLITLEPVSNLRQLIHLDVSNTAVDDLSPIRQLPLLQSLDCSGTQVKSVKDLREVVNLKYLNISNTRVWQLNWLYDIRGIKTFVCFNTRVSDRQLANFKDRFPDCEVTNY